ncbi:MAG: type II secretion system F family protein [Gammaproteobacteria bacterium]
MNETLITLGPILAPLAAFLAVMLAWVGIYSLGAPGIRDVDRRAQQIEKARAPTPASPRSPTTAKSSGKEGEFVLRILEPAGGLILPHNEWRKSKLRRQLVFAGLRQPRALAVYLGAKLATALAAGVLAAVATLVILRTQLPIQQSIAIAALCMVAGFFIPDLFLQRRISARRQDFIESFPDALDMLVVCVEAGLGLDAALNRVARELRYSHPALASELALISLEVRAGKTRLEALRALAERMEIDQVHSLTTIVIQAERFGTSIAAALRTFAEEMRVERIQRARETAAKLPVKMIFPIVTCIFPALFLVLLGPAIVQILNSFAK